MLNTLHAHTPCSGAEDAGGRGTEAGGVGDM